MTVPIHAQIMWRKRINLRYSSHCRRKGRTYRASGAYKVSVLVRLPHKLLCNDVHNGISVADNGIKLPVKTFLNYLRKLLAIHLMRRGITDFSQRFIRIFNYRRTFIRTHRRYFFTHIRNHIGVPYYYLIRLVASQILELRQHFLRCP